MKDKGLELVKGRILLMLDCDNIQKALEYFEEKRHKKLLPKTQELFDEMVISQVAILFKILMDAGEVEMIDGVLNLK